MRNEACYCCEATLEPFALSPSVEIARCSGCGSLVTEFPNIQNQKDPWEMGTVTTSFLEALKYRRSLQARHIVSHFSNQLRMGRVIDYGCGQGAFVKYMRENGIDAIGCDISKTYLDSELNDSFVELNGPWSVPDLSSVRTICFLDVLEHAPEPDTLVSELFNAGVDGVLVKVPMLHGPIGIVAQVLSRVGRPGLLHRLLLVDEISPHYSFFTSKGLSRLFAQNGFSKFTALRLADVGRELPKRMRGKDGEPSTNHKQALLSAFGTFLAGLSPFWSDTRVFLFNRDA
jgi:SAM-dependent methyltransferase